MIVSEPDAPMHSARTHRIGLGVTQLIRVNRIGDADVGASHLLIMLRKETALPSIFSSVPPSPVPTAF
ncbi:hypothetical protein [Paraburkholderia dipogonis]|uniref:hypothetical protein n=1 Tax=Paraburkholderia dipogonis TaxID=1211383 RepID=UPI00141B22E7|nr:hypothetical protein [Paraburkholderia dipogonis]